MPSNKVRNQVQAPALEEQISEKIRALQQVEMDCPAIVIVHDLRDTSVLYMSPNGLQFLGVTLKELRAMGPDYHNRYFNMEFAENYMPRILGLMERNKDHETVSYFQQVRSSPDKDWSWYLSCTKILLRDEAGRPLLIITNAVPFDSSHYFEAAKAQRMLDETAFLRSNQHLFDSLTKREKEVLTLMATGLSSVRMAKKLHISEMTASTHRRNIKKKLNAASVYDLTRFAQAFNLI